MTHIEGAILEALESSTCEEWLRHLDAGSEPPIALGERAWLLCHGDDGVTWGCFCDGAWEVGSAHFPELSPPVAEVTLQELRIFSSALEVLIWRTGGQLRGRMLRDVAAGGPTAACEPQDERRFVVGNRVLEPPRGGFSRVGDGTGAEQVLPFRAPPGAGSQKWPRLRVRHYFSIDQQSGTARIAASRLVELV